MVDSLRANLGLYGATLVVAFVAGMMKMGFTTFTAISMIGRILRYGTVVAVAGLL